VATGLGLALIVVFYLGVQPGQILTFARHSVEAIF